MKKRNFELRKNALLFNAKISRFFKEQNYDIDLEKNDNDSQQLLGTALLIFYCNANNIREIFNLALDGDVESINYDTENEDEMDEMTIVAHILTLDFFSILGNLLMKLQK